MYKKNFYDKYDRVVYKEVYEKYIDNEKFKREKAKFVYSIIDYDKYVKFVEENESIEPNELTIVYSAVIVMGLK